MKSFITRTALAVLAALILAVPKAHAVSNNITMCAPSVTPGITFPASQGNGTLVTDVNGCFTFDLNLDPSGRDMLALLRAGYVNKAQPIPWAAGAATGAPLQVSGATPTCTYTATALACIENMTANVTSVTLAGMTAAKYYTIVLMQDGTGARTLAQTSITGAPKLASGESTANSYAVWLIQATSATAATFIRDYPNRPLFDVFKTTVTSNVGQAVNGTAAAQTAPTVVAPGMSASNTCSCQVQDPTTTGWPSLVSRCTPQTNAAMCTASNASAAAITATATSLNVRIAQ